MELDYLPAGIQHAAILLRSGERIPLPAINQIRNCCAEFSEDYAIILNNTFRVVDWTNPHWHVVDGELWSLPNLTGENEQHRIAYVDSCFCKDVDENLQPMEPTKSFNSLSPLLVHWLCLRNLRKSACLTYFWVGGDSRELVLAQNIMLEYKNKPERFGFVCLDVNERYPDGKWDVHVFGDGQHICSDSMTFTKFATYPARHNIGYR